MKQPSNFPTFSAFTICERRKSRRIDFDYQRFKKMRGSAYYYLRLEMCSVYLPLPCVQPCEIFTISNTYLAPATVFLESRTRIVSGETATAIYPRRPRFRGRSARLLKTEGRKKKTRRMVVLCFFSFFSTGTYVYFALSRNTSYS